MARKKRKPQPFPRKLAPKPVVLVRWMDAYTIDETFSDDDLGHSDAPTVTVGFLLVHDKQGVTIATDVQLPSAGDMDGKLAYRGKHFVPAGMIRDITIVRS